MVKLTLILWIFNISSLAKKKMDERERAQNKGKSFLFTPFNGTGPGAHWGRGSTGPQPPRARCSHSPAPPHCGPTSVLSLASSSSSFKTARSASLSRTESLGPQAPDASRPHSWKDVLLPETQARSLPRLPSRRQQLGHDTDLPETRRQP